MSTDLIALSQRTMFRDTDLLNIVSAQNNSIKAMLFSASQDHSNPSLAREAAQLQLISASNQPSQGLVSDLGASVSKVLVEPL